MQTEVGQQTGLDVTDTTTLANIKRWINMIQQDIAGRWTWNFLDSREVVQSVIDKNAGTVSIASGGTAVTGIGTAFDTTLDVGKFIQFSGANDWYKVTAVGSTTTLTIEAPYTQTANASGAAYNLRKIFYSLSSAADRIIDIRNWNTPLKFFEIDPRTLDQVDPDPSSVSDSYAYITYGYDSNNNIVISPYPFPSDVRNYEVRTLKRLVDLVGDTDQSVIPAKWHHILCYGANMLAFIYKKQKDQAVFWQAEYEHKIDDMMRQARTSVDSFQVLKPIDSTTRTRFLQMPSQFPVVTG